MLVNVAQQMALHKMTLFYFHVLKGSEGLSLAISPTERIAQSNNGRKSG